MASASVTVDANILAIPSPDSARNDVYQYIDALLEWSKLLDEPWIAVRMSERSSEVLIADGLFPFRNQLDLLFNRQGIVEYDVNTVATVIDRLLTHTPSFETYFRVQDVLIEELSTIPDILRFCAGAELCSDFARCLVLIAILRKHCGNDILQNALILRQTPEKTIRVRALVHDIQQDRKALEPLIPKPPEYFEGNVFACQDFRGLLDCIDQSYLLQSAFDDFGVEIAIRIELYKSRIQRGVDSDWDDRLEMIIGPRFGDMLRTCINSSSSFPSRALRAICETIDKQAMSAVHALRIGPGGGDPQRTRRRDNAKAWRRDVDREYHLHYWEDDDGIIELASISVHSDFKIPE